MRIAIPYMNYGFSHNQGYGGFNITDEVITGGVEIFIKRISEHYDNVKVISLWQSREVTAKERKENNEHILKEALDFNADVIMTNWLFSSVSGQHMMSSPIPIIHVEHSCGAMMSAVNSLHRIKRNGHSVFLVNPYQKNYYDAYAERLHTKPVDFDGYVEPAFLIGEKPKPNENPEFDCGTIGRADPLKMPYKLKSMLKDTDFKTLLMTNSDVGSNSKESYNYYQKNKHWDDCLYNLPYHEVMKNLQKCRTYFMTCAVETFGITGLEALSYGIPLIINTRMSENRGPIKRQNFKKPLHASDLWAIDPSHSTNIMQNSKEELIDAINKYEDIDRQEIIDMTWDKYTIKRWKQILDNAIDKTIENFKSSIGVLSI